MIKYLIRLDQISYVLLFFSFHAQFTFNEHLFQFNLACHAITIIFGKKKAKNFPQRDLETEHYSAQ